jgi:hypothetical protein
LELIRFFSTFANDFNIVYQNLITKVRKIYLFLWTCLLLCIACEWHLKPNDERTPDAVVVERYDRIQALYLTTGDRSAMQQLNTRYPEQTRMLIEDVLNIGAVNDPSINIKFLHFYQDSVLQTIIGDVERIYSDMTDVDEELQRAFKELQQLLPDMKIPIVYAQIGALTQSIIVGDSLLGISLDKYLGTDYPLYAQYYPENQRNQMTRQMIVPDCLGFYVLSLYPMQESDTTAEARHRHMGKIQWVVNKVTHKRTFSNEYVKAADTYMLKHRHTTVSQLLQNR